MTPAERELLLAVADAVAVELQAVGMPKTADEISDLIAAVEAEAAPKEDILARVWNDETKAWDDQPKPEAAPIYTEWAAMADPVKSCETCEQFEYGDHECNYCRRCKAKEYKFWQPKPSVCPTCEGKGRLEYLHFHHRCSDCGGTGKKEKTNDHP